MQQLLAKPKQYPPYSQTMSKLTRQKQPKLFFLLLSFCPISANAKNVAVIEFKASIASNSTTENNPEKLLQRTHDLTLCFRMKFLLPPARLHLIKTDQVTLQIDETKGWLYLRPFNSSTQDGEYRRMIKYYRPYELGHWMSMCISIQLKGDKQEITVFQDGKLSFREIFAYSDFEWIYHPSQLSEIDM